MSGGVDQQVYLFSGFAMSPEALEDLAVFQYGGGNRCESKEEDEEKNENEETGDTRKRTREEDAVEDLAAEAVALKELLLEEKVRVFVRSPHILTLGGRPWCKSFWERGYQLNSDLFVDFENVPVDELVIAAKRVYKK